ncbi:MAG: Ig-like domain-containing protein, partial [Bdellovibrio sp.]
LLSIGVTAPSSSVAQGLGVQYTATGYYSDGSSANITNNVTWSVSDPALAIVSNIPGTQGLVTTLGAGSVQVGATLGNVSSSKPLGITNPALVSIAVTPSIVNLLNGLSQQMTATATYTDGSTANITNSVTWSTSGNLLCGVSATGRLTCVALTTGNVKATQGTISGQAAIVGPL